MSITYESTAAAKSFQSCPTLCDPIDSSPPGSPVPGILQARILQWVAIFFPNAWKWKVKLKSLSCVQLLVTPWTAAYQAPPSMGFSRQEYWSGLPLPSPTYESSEIDLASQQIMRFASTPAKHSAMGIDAGPETRWLISTSYLSPTLENDRVALEWPAFHHYFSILSSSWKSSSKQHAWGIMWRPGDPAVNETEVRAWNTEEERTSGPHFTKVILKCQGGTMGMHRSISMGPRKGRGCKINIEDFLEESASEPRWRVARQSGEGRFDQGKI